MKNYIGPIFGLIIIMLFYIIYSQNSTITNLKSTVNIQSQKLQTVDSLKHIIDSLTNEKNFYQGACEKYESTLEQLEEEDSISAAMFEIYLNQP